MTSGKAVTGAQTESDVPTQEASTALVGSWFENLQLYGLLGAIVATVVVFEFATGGIFLNPQNLDDLGKQVAILGVAAAGVSCVLIMGEFDISTGGATAFIASLLGFMMIRNAAAADSNSAVSQIPGYVALPVALGVALLMALLNGFIITRLARSGFRTASFIVTLAGFLAYPALAILVLPNAEAPTPTYIGDLGRLGIPVGISTVAILVAAAAGIVYLLRESGPAAARGAWPSRRSS